MKFILIVGAISMGMTQSYHTAKEESEPVHVRHDTFLSEFPDKTSVRVQTMEEEIDAIRYDKYNVTSEFGSIYTLHPILSDIAFTFILIAVILQIINIFIFKKDLAWIVLFLIVAGLTAVLIANRDFYTGVNEYSSAYAEMNFQWSLWTSRAGFVAFILQGIHLFLTKFERALRLPVYNPISYGFRKNKLIMMLVALMMLSSALCFLKTGLPGTRFVQVEPATDVNLLVKN